MPKLSSLQQLQPAGRSLLGKPTCPRIQPANNSHSGHHRSQAALNGDCGSNLAAQRHKAAPFVARPCSTQTHHSVRPLQAQARAYTACDPDDYQDDYDSDEYEHTNEPGFAWSGQPHHPLPGPVQVRQVLSEGWTRLADAVQTASKSAVRVPRETCRAVAVTAAGTAAVMRQAADDAVHALQQHSVAASAERDEAHKRGPEVTGSWEESTPEPPADFWGRVQWLWERPSVKRVRLTLSMAQWSVRLPALLALVASQVGLFASTVSLPMLAPLLLGTGMLLRSIKANASFLFPRIGLLVVLLWLLWFANSVVQGTCVYLRKQGALDNRACGAIVNASECTALAFALVIVLSMLGVNVSALLLPAGISLAFAAKDLSHNFLAGFFLFAVQPFRLGDRVAVSYSGPAAGGAGGAWFEGVCEKVDLRYTIIKSGRRRLHVPNSAFLTREFIIVDDPDGPRRQRRDLSQADPAHALQEEELAWGGAQAPSYPLGGHPQRPLWPSSRMPPGMHQDAGGHLPHDSSPEAPPPVRPAGPDERATSRPQPGSGGSEAPGTAEAGQAEQWASEQHGGPAHEAAMSAQAGPSRPHTASQRRPSNGAAGRLPAYEPSYVPYSESPYGSPGGYYGQPYAQPLGRQSARAYHDQSGFYPPGVSDIAAQHWQHQQQYHAMRWEQQHHSGGLHE